MSDMPNKIAAWRFSPSKADEWLHGGWSEDHDHKTTSYISEALAQAMVAVLKAQIYRLTASGDNLTAWVDDRGTPDVRKWDQARDEAFASIPTDARAALDAMLAKAREEALWEAAAICNRSYGGSIGDVHKAILALIDRTAEGEA